ncbi:hypothetical protein DRJ17_05430 [Candidatus Woesearchaeota archaeon]|nr:MAG: hypothetical protein DRJ17_05430 [Candidatus Woesearchaeota archaeon]
MLERLRKLGGIFLGAAAILGATLCFKPAITEELNQSQIQKQLEHYCEKAYFYNLNDKEYINFLNRHNIWPAMPVCKYINKTHKNNECDISIFTISNTQLENLIYNAIVQQREHNLEFIYNRHLNLEISKDAIHEQAWKETKYFFALSNIKEKIYNRPHEESDESIDILAFAQFKKMLYLEDVCIPEVIVSHFVYEESRVIDLTYGANFNLIDTLASFRQLKYLRDNGLRFEDAGRCYEKLSKDSSKNENFYARFANLKNLYLFIDRYPEDIFDIERRENLYLYIVLNKSFSDNIALFPDPFLCYADMSEEEFINYVRLRGYYKLADELETKKYFKIGDLKVLWKKFSAFYPKWISTISPASSL